MTIAEMQEALRELMAQHDAALAKWQAAADRSGKPLDEKAFTAWFTAQVLQGARK